MRAVAFVSSLLVVLSLPLGQVRAQSGDPAVEDSVAVVVGVSSSIPDLEPGALRDLFLKRRIFLSDGARAVPINLPVDDPARQRFSSLVLGRGPEDYSAYWDRLYYDGIRPPIVLPSAEAVRRYVQVEDRAIGYVAIEDVDDSMRVLAVIPSP